MELILLCAALLAGMLAPLQAGLNGKMGRAIGDPVYAALISFVVGALGLFCYAAAARMNFAAIRRASGMDYTVWGAGLLGAFYVTAVIILTPRLGAALTFGLVVAGQLIMAVFMGHFGILGVQTQPFSWLRLTGIALITAGVVILKKF